MAAVMMAVAAGYFSTSSGSHRFVHLLEYSFPPIAPGAAPRGDVIAVLAGTGPPRSKPLRSFETPNRMDGALALYRAGRAPFLVLTTEEGERNRLAAIELGIPPNQVLLAGPALNTAAEAHAVVTIAMEHSWRRILLVTSSFHMRRALLLFRRTAAARHYSLSVFPYPVDWQQIPKVPRNLSPDEPNQYGVELFTRSLKEMAGIFYYSLVPEIDL